MDRVLAGRYRLETKIGSGGMGTVWRATDEVLGRTVAVKILHEGLASDAAFAERFRREARAAASLAHPNVVAVYDTGEADVPFIVMEYVEGESLHNVLRRRGPLPIEDTARIARSVLAALAHAHSRGLIHRDMKPANVLFDASTGQAKVVDFGIAKGLEETGGGLTRTSGLIGTAAYLSPEQVSGREATHASDLYAVGCMLYCCLAGEPPFGGPTAIAIAMRHLRDPVAPLRPRRPDIPNDFEQVVLRALEKEPARRFTSAQEMDTAVGATGLDRREASEPQVLAAPPAETVAMQDHPVGVAVGTEALRRPSPRSNTGWLAALTAFLVVAAVAAVAVLYLQSRQPPLVEATPLPLPTPTSAPVVASSPSPSGSPSPSPTPEEDDGDDDQESPGGPLDGLPGFGN